LKTENRESYNREIAAGPLVWLFMILDYQVPDFTIPCFKIPARS